MNCSIENCDKKTYARGWCRKHYRHVVEGKHSAPLPVAKLECECGKPISGRAGCSGLCRECYYQKWIKDNKETQNAWKKEYREINKEKITKQIKDWREANKESINKYYTQKRLNIKYKISHNLRSRLYDFLSGKIKHKRTHELVGCSWDELITHIESQFLPEMTWDNYGSYWCVDHIIPYSSIEPDDKIGIEKISHFSNLRPLTIKENCSKATEDKKWKNSSHNQN